MILDQKICLRTIAKELNIPKSTLPRHVALVIMEIENLCLSFLQSELVSFQTIYKIQGQMWNEYFRRGALQTKV